MTLKTPLRKRLANSDWFKARYRSDPDFRLDWINKNRIAQGKEPLASLPPVGEARRQWASQRVRNEKGLWI